MTRRISIRLLLFSLSLLVCGGAAHADNLESCRASQSLKDAWWTGPMLAPSAATLPTGHMLVEPYLYDVASAHTNDYGSLTYILFGITNHFTAGLIPTAGYSTVIGEPSSAGIGFGDVSVIGQYRLTNFHVCGRRPIISIAAEETFPTGKFDRLGDRPTNGFGAGAYTTTLALYSQKYFVMPNGRILRMRLNATQAFSSGVNLQDASVYGTTEGFRGTAKPGASFYFDAAWEYSITRNWVVAFDATVRHNWNTQVEGYNILDPPLPGQIPTSTTTNTGSANVLAFAPAIEYNWRPYIGILLGTRIIPATRNVTSSITPAIAINFVH